jgi:hypothetical protein
MASLTGKASPRRSVCAPGMMDFHRIANHPPGIEKTSQPNSLTPVARAFAMLSTGFPVVKVFDNFDYTAAPSLPKQKVLELAQGAWVEQRFS